MKTITIIFGGNVSLYSNLIKFFDYFEKKFKTRVIKKSYFRYTSKIKDKKIEFLFCFNPKRDRNYISVKKFLKKKLKEKMPLPASEIKIKSSEAILFFGFCGGFKGKVNDIYLPNEFREIDFKDDIIKHKHIEKISPRKPIKCKNILIDKIKGKKAKIITSNLTIMPGNIEEESKEHVIKIANRLIKKGDAVEKETYQLVKKFKNKYPLGILVVASDVLHKQKYMMDLKNIKNPHFNKNKFNKICCEAIQKI